MPEMASYIGIEPRTVTANGAIARGLRCSLNASGTVDLQDNTAIGDYIALHDIEAGKTGAVASTHGGGKVPAVAMEAVNMGDPAYTGTLGRCSKTAASNVLIGKWTQPASGAGVLSEVELGV